MVLDDVVGYGECRSRDIGRRDLPIASDLHRH